VTRES